MQGQMLARIETIEQLSAAIQWMKAGQTALQAGLVLTLVLLGLSVVAVWRKDERLAHAARRGQYALFAATIFCAGLLYLGIFEGYYFVNYIQHVTENNEVTTFKITALWASQQGSLLFWCLMLTGFGAAFAFSQRHNRTDRRLPYTLAVLAMIQFFFFLIMVSPFDAEAAQRSSPFSLSYYWLIGPVMDAEGHVIAWNGAKTVSAVLADAAFRTTPEGWELLRAAQAGGLGSETLSSLHTKILSAPADLPEPVQAALLDAVSDGGGMNPNLHNYWIAIHPPMLYLGFVGFTIPFAYAVGSLLSGEVSEGWLKPIRLWTMGAWGFLTVGIALGGLWAYEILGWGGYWAWDPVENASFIPWLTGTAFIHSIIVTERRGMLRGWSFGLVIITYCMTVIGTFLVRSGVINSVHAFGDTKGVDLWFYGFMVVVFMGSLMALIWRLPLLKSDRKFESVISRESSFLFNNLILLAIALVTLVITFWPLITETFYGENGKEELGQNGFVIFNAPLFLLVLLLMGIGPALAWRRNNARQLVRAFLPPVIAATVVGITNFAWLSGRDLLISTDHADSMAFKASIVRLIVQVTLWPICAFTLVCIFLEFLSGARARARSTGENMLVALGRVTLGNRRRYGGYIVHLGVLLVALGIYYSSMYEAEGSVTTAPGGYAILDDKLSGNRYLVYYESETRSDDWDFLRDKFGQDEEMAQRYASMLAYVRQNPDKTESDIIEMVKAEQAEQFGGELPEFFVKNALPKMIVGVHWAIKQRDNKDVYESFDTTVRIFDYTAPEELNVAPYLEAHGALRDVVYQNGPHPDIFDDEAMGRLFVRRFAPRMISEGTDLGSDLRAIREGLVQVPAADLPAATGLDEFGLKSDEPAKVEHVRRVLLAHVGGLIDALDKLTLEGVKLGPELLDAHRLIREEAANLPREEFAERFGLDPLDAEAYATGRFDALNELEKFHATIETETARRRNEIVRQLAMNISEESAAEQLKALRPLSLTGLQQTREVAVGDTLAAIEREIATILEDAVTVEPGMRIFYDKRSGAPKMNEPVKDPYYYRTLARDTYFILQDSKADGTATFRYFIKPQMSLGLFGLVTIIIGTVLAFLPQFRRKRPEVA
jgi:c-type cytochrome biogenesis protein CcmF